MNYKQIEVPGQGILEFPDTMDDEEIAKIIKEKFFSHPQEIITKRDQSTVRKAERELRHRRLAAEAEQKFQSGVKDFLAQPQAGPLGEGNWLFPSGGTFDKARQAAAGEFAGTFGNILSGVDRLARKVLGDDAVDHMQTNPAWLANPVGQVMAGAGAGKWIKGHAEAARTVSQHQEGNETVAKLAGVAGQVTAFVPLALTGPAAPFLTVGGAATQSFDSTYDESFDAYKRMGFSDDEADKAAFRVSTGAGAITGTVTGMFNRYGGKFFGGLFGKGVERGLSKPLIQSALQAARQGTMTGVARGILNEVVGEATEESIDQLLQAGLSYLSYRPELTLNEAMWEVMEAGLLGGFGGGIGGGPFSAYQDIKGKKARVDQAHAIEQLHMIDQSRKRYDGKQLQNLIHGGKDAEGNDVKANPALKGLKDAEGRVLVFSHQETDKEGVPSDEKLGYMKLDDDADIDTAVDHYEQENPNANFRGAFNLSKKDGSKHYDGGMEETAADMDPDKMDIEERVDTEVQALGDEVFNPVKLGKRRIRKADLEQLYGGSVSETDEGYSIKLDNGMQLEMRFDEKFFELDTPEKIAGFEQSISAKKGIPLEKIQAMDPKARAKFRDQYKGAGANLQMKIGDEVVPGGYVQYFSRNADLHTAKHEAIHFLRQSGLMTQAEFDTLSQRYAPEAKTEEDKEDAIAYAFEDYHAAAEQRRQENRIGVFERIKEFFGKARVVDEVSGIFNAVERGELAARAKPVAEPAKDLMDVDETVDTLEPLTTPLPDEVQVEDIDAAPTIPEPEPPDPKFSVQEAGAPDRLPEEVSPGADKVAKQKYDAYDRLIDIEERYDDWEKARTRHIFGRTEPSADHFENAEAEEFYYKQRLAESLALAEALLAESGNKHYKDWRDDQTWQERADDIFQMKSGTDGEVLKFSEPFQNLFSTTRHALHNEAYKPLSIDKVMDWTKEQKIARREFEEKGWESTYFKRWWPKDAAVVDDNGNPLILNHGSTTFAQADLESPIPSMESFRADVEAYGDEQSTTDRVKGAVRERFMFRDEWSGKGMFLSTDPDFAKAFGGVEDRFRQYVTNITNPFDPDNSLNVDRLYAAILESDEWKKGEPLTKGDKGYKPPPPHIVPDKEANERRLNQKWAKRKRLKDGLSGGHWSSIEPYASVIKDAGFDGYYVYEAHPNMETDKTKNLAVFDSSKVKLLGEWSAATFQDGVHDVRYSVQDAVRGVNVNQGGASFADAIVDGDKTIETRDTGSLLPVVGKRIRIIRTGQPGEPAAYIGEATVGAPKIYKSEDEFRADQDLHKVPVGNKFDIKEGGHKWGFPLSDPVRYEKEIIAPKLRGRVMTKPEAVNFSVQLNESTIFIPESADPHVLLPHGNVEMAFHKLFNRSASPTSAALAKIPGAPKKRKGKERTYDRNVKPTSYAELKKMLEWAIENNAQGDWYDRFGRGFRELVGDANLWEASVVFGITSAQNSVEENFANTLTVMMLARQHNPVTDPAGFEHAIRNVKVPGLDGKDKGMMIGGPQIESLVDYYKTGIKEGGPKVTTYMQHTRDRGYNLFNPFSVQDRHMARVFGFNFKKDGAKKGERVDDALFPTGSGEKSTRYAMYLTTKLANEYNLRPDQVQANLWFYGKVNLSPQTKKQSDPSRDGSYESALKSGQPVVDQLAGMKADGTFDTSNPLNRATGAGIRPASKVTSVTDPWTNSNQFLQPILETARGRSPNMLVSANPGNDRGYGFGQGATFDQLVNYQYDVIEAITNADGNIEILDALGIPHEVSTVTGTFDRKEPSLDISLIGSNLSIADKLAPLFGDALLQDAAITHQPVYGSGDVGFGIKLTKPDGSQFTQAEIDKVYGLANPEKDPWGLNFTSDKSGTALKFLDGVYFQKQEAKTKYGIDDLNKFQESLLPVASGAGLKADVFSQKGNYHDNSGYKKAVRKAWNDVPASQRSGIQRAAVDKLYKPVWATYEKFSKDNKLQPVHQTPPPHLGIQFSVQEDAPLSPEVEARINAIDGAKEVPKAEQPKYEPDTRGKWNAILGRPSTALGYVGSPELLKEKQKLILEQAYQAKAVNKMTGDLGEKLLNDAYASVEGWKLPKWMRTGKWAKRLKEFQKDSLPIAAHLNATAMDASGNFTFADFDMRAGMMPVAQFKKGDHKVGDVIEVSNPLTGEMEFLTVGGFINAQGRVGYQLTRKMTADMQQELYSHYKKEYADMIWLVDMFINPNMKGVTKEVGGVKVPMFNRFSLAEMMKENDPNFEGIDAYTPDVLATRSLTGMLEMVMNPTRASRSPGRKYKTGKSRESGNVRDLLTGFNIRTFQALNEASNKLFAEQVFEMGTESIPKEGGLPKGYVRLSTGIDDLLSAVKAYRYYENPSPEEEGYSEAAARLSELDNPESYSKLLAEAYKRKGRDFMIREDLVKLLTNKYSHASRQNRVARALNWGIRNSTQMFLTHPYTYMVNMLTNDYFAVEASFHRAFRGTALMLKKDTRSMGKADIDQAGRIVAGMVIHRAAGIRQLMGFKTQYDRVIEEVLPDEVFQNSTALADLKVSYDTGWYEYLKEGEIGAAGLQLIRYGNIDLRPKQRLAYAYLKSQAVRRAKDKGLKGKALKDEVDSYMLNPPEEARIEAVNQAQFEFLNYADSPQFLQWASAHDWTRLVVQYPRFGYHYAHKQYDRLKALRNVFGKQPPGRRADALAHVVTLATFTGGLGGAALHYILKSMAGDDDDDSAQYIGNYQIKYRDQVTGEVKTKKIDYSMITSNRINLSKYFEAMGIGDGDGEDFWWRVRNYPMIAMAGASVQAIEDGRKFGAGHGVATWLGMAKDLATDMTTIGAGMKVGSKALASLKSMDTGMAERPALDPYGATVPFSFYLTEAAMSSFIPGKRQFEEIALMIDPIHRRRTASKQIGYDPGPWEAIRQGHATGAIDRLLTTLGAADPLPPGGKVENVSGGMSVTGTTKKSRQIRREAKAKQDTSAAGQYYDTNGNLRLGVVPDANIRKQELWQTGVKAAGFNLKTIDRRLYLDQLGPPKRKKSIIIR